MAQYNFPHRRLNASEVVEASGHLIDSGLLNGIFDTVIRHGAAFEVLRFSIGRTNAEPSVLSMRVSAESAPALRELIEDLVPLGCNIAATEDVVLRAADLDGCAPVDFYSTTNHETHVRYEGQWVTVDNQRMDAAIVLAGGRAFCRKLRDLRKGEAVVCGVTGIRVVP